MESFTLYVQKYLAKVTALAGSSTFFFLLQFCLPDFFLLLQLQLEIFKTIELFGINHAGPIVQLSHVS